MSEPQYDRYGVVLIKGSDPEVFWVIFASSSSLGMKFSDDFSETTLRKQLAEWGLSAARIAELIANARANPK